MHEARAFYLTFAALFLANSTFLLLYMLVLSVARMKIRLNLLLHAPAVPAE